MPGASATSVLLICVVALLLPFAMRLALLVVWWQFFEARRPGPVILAPEAEKPPEMPSVNRLPH
jgi:hypothetical protein